MSEIAYNIKTNRAFTTIRRWAWLITIIVALGGQFWPYLGLIVPVIIAALIVVSFFKGRYWCGNFCPHGSLYDRIILPLSRNKFIPGFFKSRPVVAAAFIYFGFNMTRRFLTVFQQSEGILVRTGFIFSNTYLMVLIVGGLLGLTISSRNWCQFCPMGTLQLMSYRLGKFLGVTSSRDELITAENPELCHSCARCSRVCPMQLEPHKSFKENSNQFEAEQCIRCNTCVENCPSGILQLATSAEAQELKNRADLTGFNKARFFQAKISRIREFENPDIKEYTFKFLEPAEMEFIPGQFLLVEVEEEKEMYRAYTISGSDADKNQVTITIKRIADGYGTNIIFDEFQEGKVVTIKGPMGRELTVDDSNKNMLFIANGIGITPFTTIAENLFAGSRKKLKAAGGSSAGMKMSGSSYPGKAALLYGARHEEDLIYDNFFAGLARDNKNFDYQRVLSRPRTDKYKQGYVTHLLKDMELNSDTEVYICGSRPMAEDARKILKNKGIPADQINYEDFGI